MKLNLGYCCIFCIFLQSSHEKSVSHDLQRYENLKLEDRQTNVKKYETNTRLHKRQADTPCEGTCRKRDHIGTCRLSISCMLTRTDTYILRGGGCARCRIADPSGRCRLVISCIMGLNRS